MGSAHRQRWLSSWLVVSALVADLGHRGSCRGITVEDGAHEQVSAGLLVRLVAVYTPYFPIA